MSLMINLASASYNITIEPSLRFQLKAQLEALGAERIAVVSDSTVWALHGDVVRQQLKGCLSSITVLPPGEHSKSNENLLCLYRNWLEADITRNDLVLAFGGGVIGDLTGYAAATYMRGVPFVQLPTTLLAQVDSSIGGKVAINLPEGKNLAGTFYHPVAVLIDQDYLNTLPDRIFNDGMGEVVKAGCIGDERLYRMLQKGDISKNQDAVHEMIQRSLMVKKGLVEIDEKEKGLRKLLNFGHTIGHALEAFGNFSRWTHGEAVAMGMVWATECSEAAGLSRPGTASELVELLKMTGLPVESGVSLNELMVWLNRDKKRSGRGITLALIKEPGAGFLHDVRQDAVEAFLSRK